ncbi:hypothetical protein, partial [Crossiella equi]
MARGENLGLAVQHAEAALAGETCRFDPLCVWRALVTLVCAGELVAADTYCPRLTNETPLASFTVAQRHSMVARTRARIARQCGDLGTALEILAELIDADVSPGVRLVAVAWSAEVLVRQGGVDRAEALLAKHDFDTAVGWRMPMRPMLLAGRAVVHLAAGRALPGLRDYHEAQREFAVQGVRNPSVLPWPHQMPLAALAAHREDVARKLARQGWEDARRWGEVRSMGMALTTLALVEGEEQALDRLTQALELLELARARAELSGVHYEIGVRQAAKGDLG